MKKEINREMFYRSVNCPCNAIVYIEKNGSARLIKGSTLVYDESREEVDVGECDKFPTHFDLLTDLFAFDVVDTDDHLRLKEDFRTISLESATALMLGRDVEDPEKYWDPIFTEV